MRPDRMHRLPHTLLGRWLAALLFTLIWLIPARAQTFPNPQFATVTPSGAKAGTTVEVTLTGKDLDDVTQLLASHQGIKAERLPDPPPPSPMKGKKKKPAPTPALRFKITVAPNTPMGIHDLRVVGKWGISNPRAFVVGDRPEVPEKEPNSDVPQAQRIALGTVIHGSINPKVDVDYYVFSGKKGQRVVVHCATSSIDSKLYPELRLFDAKDRQLAVNRGYHDRDALLDCVLSEDGDYFVRVCEFTYLSGGPEYFYRLSLSTGPWIDAVYPPAVEPGKTSAVTLYGRNLPGGQPVAGGQLLEKLVVKVTPPPTGDRDLTLRDAALPRLGSIDGFEYRLTTPAGQSNAVLLTFADAPVVLDNEDNDTAAKAQEIAVPACVCGRMEKLHDRDWYAFTAKKGEVYVIEGYADRLRSPADLVVTLRQAGTDKVLAEFDDNPEIPQTVGRFYTRTADPRGRFVAPADGRYELLVRGRTSDALAGARYTYRLSIRKERPDFRLVLVGNNDASAGGFTLRQGGNRDLEVICFRQDGYAGEVLLTAEGLPQGVTCVPQVVGPKAKQTVLVLNAAADAPLWAGAIKIKGTALIDGQKVVREARPGCVVWPMPQANVPAISRLARSLCLAVREKGPYSLSVPSTKLAVPVGSTVQLKLGVKRLWPDFKANVQIDTASAPVQNNGKFITIPKLNVAANQTEGTVKFQVPNNTTPGDYNLVFRAKAKFPFVRNPKAKQKKKTNVDFSEVTPAVRLTVYNTVAELNLDNAKVAVGAGDQTVIGVKLKRLHDYKGNFKVQLVPPKGFQGVNAAAITLPPGANEAKLVVKVVPNAKPATNANFVVRATATLNKATLTQETKLAVTVTKRKDTVKPKTATPKTSTPKTSTPKTARPAADSGKTMVLLPEGAKDWKFLPAAQVKGKGWLALDFNDKDWRMGKAPLGYGEAEIAARKGTTVNEKGVPFVFRRAFDVPGELLSRKGVTFRLAVASDDSAVVYMNGALVDADPDADHEFHYWNRNVVVPADRLRAGRNVVAVRVRNNKGSSDLYLDVRITAEMPTAAARK